MLVGHLGLETSGHCQVGDSGYFGADCVTV